MPECLAKIIARLCLGSKVRYGRQLKEDAGEGDGSSVEGWLSQTPMCA